jgi:endonuclease G, mitochondrial
MILKIKIFAFIWAFLLLSPSVTAQQEIYCKHFFYGYPLGTPKTNDLIIRDIYALSSNDSTKFADWVAYRLDKKTVTGTSKTSRQWKADPWLEDNETLEPDDYKDATEKLKVDRGHQAPLASFKGTDDWAESNYLSNITPQKSDLNRGPWKELEEKERKLLDSFEVIYVMTGPLYERNMGKLPGADESHVIPSGYWKIIIVPMKKKEFNVAAFVFDQNTSINDKIINHAVNINEIEKRSHLNFLWQLDDKIEEKIESEINKSWIMKYF